MTAAGPLSETLCLLMLDCGLRVSEAVSLPWALVDPSGPWITVAQGKGRRDRVVPLARHTLDRLMSLRQPGPWLCPRALDPSEHIRERWARHLVHEVGRAAGLPHLHPHMLRHTYAVGLLRAGVPLVDIQLALGHTRLDTTAIYLRVEPAEAGARIRAALAPATQLELLELVCHVPEVRASPDAACAPPCDDYRLSLSPGTGRHR